MKVSLVMSTLGRLNEVIEFIESLKKINHKNFELIIVDQNDGFELQSKCESISVDFPFHYLRTPGERGLSRGRNAGLEKATGDILCFPDDDCIYPPLLINNVIQIFESDNVDIVCGRAAALDGRSINGRFESVAQTVSRENVFTTQIEWVVFFKRDVFKKIGGYDEKVGVGASTPWQSCEGPEVTLRALKAGFRARYDPAIYAFHPELNIDTPNNEMIVKGRRYARGMGHVLKRHDYGFLHLAWFVVRPLGGAFLAITKFRRQRARYYLNVALGRVEGYIGFVAK